MALTVVLLGGVVLVALAVVVGLVERRAVERAFRDIAENRRSIHEANTRLQERESGLRDLEQTLRERQEDVRRLVERIRQLERRLPSGGGRRRPPSDGQSFQTDDDMPEDTSPHRPEGPTVPRRH